ncbi:YegP family protein [Antarcticibacterium sp. 1MA-6-2]|uniref:YegP family protein n=1 Tax=Antarcticibacterium sp. 1MA-6-2 TaxID=2908210 RepID=UPI001F278652|nr:YegP family protein [Antarcticibacterium sp. 1MA-6-2]UJH92712.1 YegP family protein [Antarcticibacterium sp. 1MA-6-2]
MGKFEIKKDKAGEFRFNLKAGNGQVILSSEGYKAKPSCMNGIESVRTNSQSDERFERKETATGHRFNLKSTNGQVIGTSEVYTTVSAMENGIASVKKNAPDATIDDNS